MEISTSSKSKNKPVLMHILPAVLVCLLLTIYMVSPSLNPLDTRMFDFHDETQPGRITEFVLNLKAGQIPPRLAPEYSFNLGFPVFNFYAPFAYWVTGFIALAGVSSVMAVKISFLLAILLSFVSMYYLLSKFFRVMSSLVGASIYVTSTYFATEIVIRGNLSESWFLVLFPLSLALLIAQSKQDAGSGRFFSVTALIFSFLFTVHNILSLLSVGLLVVAAIIFPRSKKNLSAILLALVGGAYFLLPALVESNLVQAASLAKQFNYKDHFLCIWQLWTARGWQLGGSLPGCEADMMSFKLGKIQVLAGLLGFSLFFIRALRTKKFDETLKFSVFIAVLVVVSLFLTTYYSEFIWDLLSPIMGLFQFPWRFLVFGMLGAGYFAAYFFDTFKIPLKTLMAMAVIVVVFMTGRKYFIKPLYSAEEYGKKYNSPFYIREILAYNMREYLVKNADFEYWRKRNPLEKDRRELGFDYNLPVDTEADFKVTKNAPFIKEVFIKERGDVYINVHYFPYWRIYLNGLQIHPDRFDALARPLLKIVPPSKLVVVYKQTLIEQMGNFISMSSSVFIAFLFVRTLRFRQFIKKKLN